MTISSKFKKFLVPSSFVLVAILASIALFKIHNENESLIRSVKNLPQIKIAKNLLQIRIAKILVPTIILQKQFAIDL